MGRPSRLSGTVRSGVPGARGEFGRISSWRYAVSEPSKHHIEVRAYRLWEEAGCPKDRDAEFWQLAEQQLRNEDKASPIRTPDTL